MLWILATFGVGFLLVAALGGALLWFLPPERGIAWWVQAAAGAGLAGYGLAAFARVAIWAATL